MERTIFSQHHDDFRAMIRTFLEGAVVPVFPEWLDAKLVPRDFFYQLGKLGVLGMNIPEEYGGSGAAGYLFSVVLHEEVARAMVHLGPLRCHLDVVMPYFLEYSNAEQRRRWLPKCATGEMLTAIAMTEPETGSDLGGIRTVAVRDGDSYILTGAKTFITGGIHADAVIVVARTADTPNRRDGLSLIVVEDGMPGFAKGANLAKVGLAVQDTAELAFDHVRVPVSNLLGREGEAFRYLMHNLAGERLGVALNAVSSAQAALDVTLDYVNNRRVFGKTLNTFQNTKFELASVATEVAAGQAMFDAAAVAHDERRLDPVDAAKVKLFCSELQTRVVDRCLQLFGGYGYMMEYPIARLFTDARVTRIYGGTSEVMKTIISKSLGL
ncbi:acyl-CoA dehydrogenase family protein [Mycobacterium sp. CVI_P3]|uniref:Acyl-CoA dehydrogenase family protein n=1 Tax=Mycobacterium pinniadriaticum TaxID=2994102 RepID=A0ABT3SAE0_9MYCO|nr:acyl-CoA dehydrogenase family protein [Mycobacterium pinniadriaticum]MCX2929875.1 acyl-CoA dehydrogenase family protein [Mycobacterium pinniadriaticum]MCX2936476.1 acyl-CoA dehydrogenase family protein [Mycobacterium pinniadriaticum]